MKGTQEKKDVLGIDFGTTYTFVIKSTSDGDGKLYPIGENSELYENISEEGGDIIKYSNGIRTVIGYSNECGWKIGEKAIKNQTKMDICFNLKEKLLMIAKELPNVPDAQKNQDAQKSQDDQEKSGYIAKRISELEEIEERIDNWINSCIKVGEMEIEDRYKKYGYVFNINGIETFYNAIKLTKIFFNLLFNCEGECDRNQDPMVTKQKPKGSFNVDSFDDVKCIVIGAPAENMGTDDKAIYYSEVILQGILCYVIKNILGLKNIEGKDLLVIPEPQLAGKAFIAEEHMQELCDGKQLLVIDIGGGTTDFAVLQKSEGKYFAPIPASGDIEIAGNCFDKALVECVEESHKEAERENFADESVRTAKEQLFLTKQSSEIKNLAEKNNKAKDEIYKDYLDHGRRTVIVDKNKKGYGIVWEDKHKKGITHDIYDGMYFKKLELKYGDTNFFYKYSGSLVEKLRKYVNTPEVGKNLKWEDLKVLFVGGSSRMKELCEELCEKGLGLNKVGNEEEGYRWYKCEGNQQCEIHCYFNEAWENEASKLTCANMIAIGAVRFAQDQLSKNSDNAIYSAPTLFIGIPTFKKNEKGKKREPEIEGMEYYLLLSQEIKNGAAANLDYYTWRDGRTTKSESKPFKNFFPLRISYECKTEENIKETKEDKEDIEVINFVILKNIISPLTENEQMEMIQLGDNYYKRFPTKGWYSFNVNIKNIQVENGKYRAYFLADTPQGKETAVFVLLSRQATDQQKDRYPNRIVTGYNYKFSYENKWGEGALETRLGNLYGVSACCKRYILYRRNNTERFNGKRYSIFANLKDGYGWITGNNKNNNK